MNTPGRSIHITIQVVIERDDGGYHAFCPALKGLHVQGNTEGEATDAVKDAILAYLESLIKHGDPIPVGITQSDPCETAERGGEKCRAYTESLALSAV